jgi:3',5'-cyclic AMP phosphodiesterase CpdA
VTTVLHISDLHFGTEVPQAIEALVRLARAQPPDVLIVSGDITQRARRSQFDAARRFIERLAAAHVLVIAGNHDIPLFDLPRRLLAPYAGFRRAFGDELEPRLETPSLRIAAVHTARAWRHVVGHVAPAQAARAAAWLAEAPPRALRIVVTHQPALVPDHQDAAQRLRGGDEALLQWSQARVHLVLGGHIHRPYFQQASAPVDAGPHRLWVAQAGTAVSHRLRAPYPHSVNRLRETAPGHWQLQRWNLEPGATDFSCSDTLPLTTDAARSPPPGHVADAG